MSENPKSVDEEKRQYALDNFAGILKNVEFFEDNFESYYESVWKFQPEVLQLVVTGYYVSLGSLIRNKKGMDYTKIFGYFEEALRKNIDYSEQNKILKCNISVLREWEDSLKDEMQYILDLRDKYFAHIDFVNENFLLNRVKNKDKTKQNDLTRFFRNIINICEDYSAAVLRLYNS